MIVGSHVDILSSDPQQLKEKCDLVKEIAQHTIRTEQFAGFVPLDCRQLSPTSCSTIVETYWKVKSRVTLATPGTRMGKMPFSSATCCVAFSPTRSARQL